MASSRLASDGKAAPVLAAAFARERVASAARRARSATRSAS
jgi:hypothetical protein